MSFVVIVDMVANSNMHINNSDIFQHTVQTHNTKTTNIAQALARELNVYWFNCHTLLRECGEMSGRQRNVLNNLRNPGRVQFRLLLYSLMREIVREKHRVVFCNFLQDMWDAVYLNHIFEGHVQLVHFVLMDNHAVRRVVYPEDPLDMELFQQVIMPLDVCMSFDRRLETSTPERQIVGGMLYVQSNLPPLVTGLMAQVGLNSPFEMLWLAMKLYECRYRSYNRRETRPKPHFIQLHLSSASFLSERGPLVEYMMRRVCNLPAVHSAPSLAGALMAAPESFPLVDRRQRFAQLPEWVLHPENSDWRSSWPCGDHAHSDFGLLDYYEVFLDMYYLTTLMKDHEMRVKCLESGNVVFVQATPLVEQVFFQLFDERYDYYYSVNTMPAVASNSSVRCLVMITGDRAVAIDRRCNIMKLVRTADLVKRQDAVVMSELAGTLLDARMHCDPTDRSVCVLVYDALLFRNEDVTARSLWDRQKIVGDLLLPLLVKIERNYNTNRVHERVHFLKTIYRPLRCRTLLQDLTRSTCQSLFFVPERCPYNPIYQDIFDWRNNQQIYMSLFYCAADNTLNTWDANVTLSRVVLPVVPNYQTVDVLVSRDWIKRFRKGRASASELNDHTSFLRVQRHNNVADTTDYVALKLFATRLTHKWFCGKLRLLAAVKD